MRFYPLFRCIYERFTPFIQVIGWMVVAIPVLWTAFCGVNKVLAYDTRLSFLETQDKTYKDEIIEVNTKVDKVSNKLEDVMEFWQVPHRRSEP